jgi:DNA helicase II / ATP-dependent DNA helicase PcrA
LFHAIIVQMTSHLNGLNDRQKEAVLQTEGPLLIVAGAGAGKTKTVTHRIAHLVSQGVRPQEILAVTFTNKAGKEMRERVHTLLSSLGIHGSPFVSTFHALGVMLLRENFEILGLPKSFVILDESDAVSLIKQAVIDSQLDPKQFEPKKFKSIISKQKGDGITLASFRNDVHSANGEIIFKIWKRYEELAKKEGGLDFDDLLLLSAKLLTRPEIREKYNKRFRYVHIDEYQDTNQLQYDIAMALTGPNRNICVVGDSDQTIYSWRGANIKNILNFEKDFPDAKVVLLEENYRSTATILGAANEIIKKNEMRNDKTLFTKQAGGELITLCEAYDEMAEAEYVAQTVDQLLKSGADPEKIAVLYRANFQSRTFEDALLMAQVPYQVLGTKFFERREVKDVLAYIRSSLNQESFSDIRRIINVPTRGIGKTTIDKLFAIHVEKGNLAEQLSESQLPSATQKKIGDFFLLLQKIKYFAERHQPSETVRYVVTESGFEKSLKDGSEEDRERLENMRELATLATKYDTQSDIIETDPVEGLYKLLEDAALASDQDSLLKDTKGVRLMTVHASKGLEFNTVFIVGLEHDLFPHARSSGTSKEDREEERRLFYVAITRAEKKLFLTHATIRTIFGSKQIQAPSEFLYDIPEELLDRTSFGSRFNSGRVIYI